MTAPRRTLAALIPLLALAIVLAPAAGPGARAEDPTPTPPVETPTPEPTPTPTPEPTPTPLPTPTLPPIGSPESPMSAHLSGDVYGYLPYWEMSMATLDYLDWNALSAISLFSVTWTGSGSLDQGQPGYRAITGSVGSAVCVTR